MTYVNAKTFFSVIPTQLSVGATEADVAVTLDSTTDSITAGAGGGAGNAVKLTSKMNRITTVATANDSVMLPPAVSGLVVVINNASANAAGVFPQQNNDAINAGANNAVFLQSTGTTSFRSYTTGKWVTS